MDTRTEDYGQQRDYFDPLVRLEAKCERLRAKAERDFFKIKDLTHWDYETQLRKIDGFEAIWRKRIAESK